MHSSTSASQQKWESRNMRRNMRRNIRRGIQSSLPWTLVFIYSHFLMHVCICAAEIDCTPEGFDVTRPCTHAKSYTFPRVVLRQVNTRMQNHIDTYIRLCACICMYIYVCVYKIHTHMSIHAMHLSTGCVERRPRVHAKPRLCGACPGLRGAT